MHMDTPMQVILNRIITASMHSPKVAALYIQF